MLKPLVAVGAGALGLGGLLFATGVRPFSASSTSASSVQQPAQPVAGSTAVDCGEGRHAVVQQANGQTLVRCAGPAYDSAWATPAADGTFATGPLAVPQGAATPMVYASAPPQAQPLRVASAPPSTRAASGYRERRVVKRGRTWKKSAAIIGGSTAAGAGVGALLGGGGGAKKGAVVGLVGGTVYDIATRNH